MELLCRILILKWHPSKRKIAITRLKKKNMHCYSLKIDYDALCKDSSKRPAFVIRPLKPMINYELDRLYLQKFEYEMDSTYYPVD